MVRISVELVNDSYQFINAVRQREISLRNLQIPTIENLGVTRDQFDVIDLSDNNIRKLNNLPLLKRLDTLLLHNNRVQFIDNRIVNQLPNMRTLALTNNNIIELGDIDALAKCKKLEYLTLMGNPLTHKPRYRAYVVYKLKYVRVLDFRRITQAEREAAKKLFKGSTGEKLRKEIAKATPTGLEDSDADRIALLKRKPDAERNKIKDLIKGAKTLADVEHVQAMLQSGRLPASGGWSVSGITNGAPEDQVMGQEVVLEMEVDEQPVHEQQIENNGIPPPDPVQAPVADSLENSNGPSVAALSSINDKSTENNANLLNATAPQDEQFSETASPPQPIHPSITTSNINKGLEQEDEDSDEGTNKGLEQEEDDSDEGDEHAQEEDENENERSEEDEEDEEMDEGEEEGKEEDGDGSFGGEEDS